MTDHKSVWPGVKKSKDNNNIDDNNNKTLH